MRRSIMLLLSALALAACSGQEHRLLNLSDLGNGELSVTLTTSDVLPLESAAVTIDIPLRGSDPNAGVDEECARLSPQISVQVNGVQAWLDTRGGRPMNTWSGCYPSSTAGAALNVKAPDIDILLSDGSSTRSMQIPLTLPSLENPVDSRAAVDSEVLVRLPGLSRVADSVRFSAQLYPPDERLPLGNDYSSPRAVDLELIRDGDLFRLRMPSVHLGQWTMFISHPNRRYQYELPVGHCEFRKCTATLDNDAGFFPGIPLEIVQ